MLQECFFPNLMPMLMQLLGKDYMVWDKAAEIEFVSPGRGTVYSTTSIEEEQLGEIKRQTESGETYLPKFEVRVVNGEGNLVATVLKTL